ncbi:helix-turn-helix domain-containing protein [Adhaeribacter arboris]|uniref:helix-turn-helix domain-containing protein n=1 Tax=Adhaeribacter arboris TaxID=2072846 RepID=UPI001304AF87|nr:helix-turn-helix domain-containing protein [Adhaeribacter arboris]
MALISLFKKSGDNIRKKTSVKAVDKDKIRLIVWEMEQNKLYKNPDLSLPMLAQQLGWHPNEVSKLINEGLDKTFADFVNEFRLNEVKDRLLKGEDQQFTLLGIALEAGFNSKTTFNRVFKEQTGMPPKAYKKSTQIIKRNDTAISGS